MDLGHERATTPMRHLRSTFHSEVGESNPRKGPSSVGDRGSRHLRVLERTKHVRPSTAENYTYRLGERVTFGYLCTPFGDF